MEQFVTDQQEISEDGNHDGVTQHHVRNETNEFLAQEGAKMIRK